MKKFRIRFFTARKIVLFALMLSLGMLFAYLYVDNRALQKALLITASFIFFGSFVVLTALFRCPVCGCPFMRKALVITKCPACGRKLDDFYLGEKSEEKETRTLYEIMYGSDEEEEPEEEDEYYEEDFEEYADEEYEELPEEE